MEDDQDRPGADEAVGGLLSPPRRGLTIGLVLTITLVAFEALAVITILPAIKDDLEGIRLYGWATSAFQLGLMVGIVVAGGQADRRGPVPPFVAGIALFAAGLVVGGLAPTMLVLVLGRALQGLGAGAVPAVAYAVIGRSYPEALRPRVFAVLSTAWVVPGLVGPAVSALVAERLGWRWVFLGLLPLVVASAALAVPSLRRIGPPARPVSPAGRPGRAVAVAAATGLVLAGLSSGSPLAGAALVAAGLLLGVRPLRRLLPPGTLAARRGLPVTVLSRGLLTFAFFGADTYVPLALTAVRGRSTAVASVAVTAATLSWTAAAWVQERKAADWPGRRLIRAGFLIVAAGIACELAALFPGVPVAVGVAGWAVGGFGIGLAYSPVSLIVLGEAPSGQEGVVSASLQLADTLGVALGAGLGGVLVAVGAAAGWAEWAGIAGAYALTATVAVAAAVLARRIPSRTLPRPARAA
ncbi:MAG TPA: MFS transporter [Actinomycetes bacterium]|nr:MFS transporter [Actinomycetes bacterium]